MSSVRHETRRSLLQQLRNHDDVPVASQRARRAGVQRLRSLLQAARRQQAVDYEER